MTISQEYTLAISKEQISELPKVEFNGTIKIIDTTGEAVKAVKALKKYGLLGFDTESKPMFRKGATARVSLIQISAADVCFLFRIFKMKDLEPLRAVIENPDIMKIGLSLKDDFNNLSHNYNFNPQGFVDLQQVVPQFRFSSTSLQKIYAILFDKRISKSQRLSNWEAPELTAAQQQYAAIDAWACTQIYCKLYDPDFNPAESKYKVPISTGEDIS